MESQSCSSGSSDSEPVGEIRRVMLIDDHPIVREGICQIIEDIPGFTVAWQQETADAALADLESERPDLVITDISLPGRSGLALIKDMIALREGLKILVLSMHDESLYVERVLKSGALGYVNKDQPADTIRQAVEKVAAGDIYVSPAMASQMIGTLAGSGKKGRSGVANLSDRQLEIFHQIGAGKRTTDIAHTLRISVKTVETHRDNIRERLGIADSYELRRFAAQWLESRPSNSSGDK